MKSASCSGLKFKFYPEEQVKGSNSWSYPLDHRFWYQIKIIRFRL